MKKHSSRAQLQQGFMLLESLIAILIFAFGVLGIVALSARAVSAQSDAQYRTEAANLADEMAAKIALSVDRLSLTSSVSAQLQAFATPSANALVSNWLDKVTGTTSSINDPAVTPGLPGATVALQTIVVTGNRLDITVSWKGPADTSMRKNTLVTYVN